MSTDSAGGGLATAIPTSPAAAERRATDNRSAERLRVITAPGSGAGVSLGSAPPTLNFAGCKPRIVDRPVGANTRFRSAACTRESSRRERSIAPLSRSEVSVSRDRKRRGYRATSVHLAIAGAPAAVTAGADTPLFVNAGPAGPGPAIFESASQVEIDERPELRGPQGRRGAPSGPPLLSRRLDRQHASGKPRDRYRVEGLAGRRRPRRSQRHARASRA